MSSPVLPPIKKHHKLNAKKAIDQVSKNVLACQDHGSTSQAYRPALDSSDKNFIKILKTSTTGADYEKKQRNNQSQSLSLNSLELSEYKLNFKLNSIDKYRKKNSQFVVDIDEISKLFGIRKYHVNLFFNINF